MSEDAVDPLVSGLQLREIFRGDLPIFYEQQLDPVANYMAAFTVKDPADREAFTARWANIATDETIISRTILYEEQVVGSIVSFEIANEREVSYWLGRKFWGQGLATAALAAFLNIVEVRPLYGRAAKDNIGSIRVMQKCGFSIIEEDVGFAEAREETIEEFILRLDNRL
jgi:RimJ/RimL family protein N-acetyltransferase